MTLCFPYFICCHFCSVGYPDMSHECLAENAFSRILHDFGNDFIALFYFWFQRCGAPKNVWALFSLHPLSNATQHPIPSLQPDLLRRSISNHNAKYRQDVLWFLVSVTQPGFYLETRAQYRQTCSRDLTTPPTSRRKFIRVLFFCNADGQFLWGVR